MAFEDRNRRAARPAAPRRAPTRRRPRLETLEGRWLLAVLTPLAGEWTISVAAHNEGAPFQAPVIDLENLTCDFDVALERVVDVVDTTPGSQFGEFHNRSTLDDREHGCAESNTAQVEFWVFDNGGATPTLPGLFSIGMVGNLFARAAWDFEPPGGSTASVVGSFTYRITPSAGETPYQFVWFAGSTVARLPATNTPHPADQIFIAIEVFDPHGAPVENGSHVVSVTETSSQYDLANYSLTVSMYSTVTVTVLVEVAQGSDLGQSEANFDVLLRAQGISPIEMTVEADQDDLPDPLRFGPYVPGLPRPIEFTLAASGFRSEDISEYRYRVGNGDFVPVQLTDVDPPRFTIDVGHLLNGQHDLVVEGLIDGEVRAQFVGRIHMTPFPWSISARPTGTDAPFEPVNSWRFIEGATDVFDFRVELDPAALPAHYHLDDLRIYVRNVTTGAIDDWGPAQEGEFTRNVADWTDIRTHSSADYAIYLGPRPEVGDPAINSGMLYAVVVSALPPWMAQPSIAFAQNEEVAAVFGADEYAYVIDFTLPGAPWHMDLAGAGGGPLADLADLPSSLGLGVELRAFARPTWFHTHGRLKVVSVFAELELFGQTLLGAAQPLSYEGADDLIWLDAITLTRHTTFNFVAPPIDMLAASAAEILFERSFGPADDALWPIPAPFALDDLEFGLQGSLAATLTELQVGATLSLAMSGPTATFAPSGTFVEVRVRAETLAPAPMELYVAAGDFDLAATSLGAAAFLHFEAHLRGELAGQLAAPTVVAPAAGSTAEVLVGYRTDWDLPALNAELAARGGAPVDRDQFTTLTRFLPFDAAWPPRPTDLHLAALAGEAEVDELALRFGAPGPAGEGGGEVDPTAAALVGAARLAGVVDAGDRTLTLHATVLANAPPLAADVHYFEVAAIDSTGGEIVLARFDLAELASPDEIVGPTTPLSIALAEALEFGRSYRIELRLLSDAAAGGGSVMLVVTHLALEGFAPLFGVIGERGWLAHGPVALGVDSPWGEQAQFTLRNMGDIAVEVRSLSLVGAGFSLVDPPTAPFTLFAGGAAAPFTLAALNTLDLRTATLVVETGDPRQPSWEIEVTNAGLLPPPGQPRWQNSLDPHDVDGSGFVSLHDALLIVHALRQHGIGRLANAPPVFPPPSFVDTTGDWLLSLHDVVVVINRLRQQAGAGEAAVLPFETASRRAASIPADDAAEPPSPLATVKMPALDDALLAELAAAHSLARSDDDPFAYPPAALLAAELDLNALAAP